MRVDAGALTMSVRRSGEDVFIELSGELDTAGRLRFREQIGELLGRGGGTVTVDVAGLQLIDIPGLAALLRADLLLRRVHSELRISSPTPAFAALLRETGLDGRLRVGEGARRP
ncbi:STAS domain-containing protein [Frankia gtarii]|uniref:STAS domain-containing protein n=1 Tax=Frankia gtarii TaxID=2950102 RepID=UPI0021C0C09D|nr:STAS domain-containing protein [Frankia gtarii]